MRLVFATGNAGKMREIREIMEDSGYEIVSMKEAGVDPEIDENGTSFEENAMIKAREVSKLLPNDLVLADDSGLEVDALNKEPGVYSARYLGHDTPYSVKNADIIRRLEGKKGSERSARFVCAIAAVFPDGTEKCVRATIEGQIDYEEKGEHGFGFDPIFYVPELGCTTAEIPEEEKNKISHRGKALRLMRSELLKHESTDRQ